MDKKGKAVYSNMVVLKNNALVSGFKIYPNPAKDLLTVTLPANFDKQLTLLVTDIAGKAVLNKVTQGIKNGGIFRLDISQLTSGTYFLQLTGAEVEEQAAIKFVKR